MKKPPNLLGTGKKNLETLRVFKHLVSRATLGKS